MPARSPFHRSSWIWPESHNWDIHNSYALFRKEFTLGKVPRKAPLFITADQSYQLTINGEYVCRGPARGYQDHWPYDEVEVARYLRRGRNVIAVRAYNPGFSNFQYLTQGYAGLLVAAPWAGVHSDATWKCRRQSGVNVATVPASLQLFSQEHIDLRVEDPEWMMPDFDDSRWTERPACAAWNSMPWNALEERGIPLLEEKLQADFRGVGVSQGASSKNHFPCRDVAGLRHGEGLRHEPKDFTADEIVVPATGMGRFASYLLDCGRIEVGSVGFEIAGAKGGEIIDTFHVETIDGSTCTPHFVPDAHCRMAFGHRLVCRAGRQKHTFHHSYGFRYMVVTVRDSRTRLRLRPHLRTTLYPLEQRGNFCSSERRLEDIWNTCAWTQRVCSLDAFVDTPWREQAQWWGDARVQARNTFHYSGDTRLFRRGLAQIAGQTAPNGLTYGNAPTMAHNCILPDFTLIWMITLWDYFWQTGSTEPFLAHQETLERALGYFEEMTDPATGLVGYDPRYWLFLDWTGLFKDGYSSVYNLWLLIALDKMAELHRLSGNARRAKELAAWARRLRKALSRLIGEDGLLCDGLTFAGKRVKTCSIHAQTLAILARLDPRHDAARLENVLLPFIRGREVEVSPSAFWVTYVLEVLIANGRSREVVEYIARHWEPMAKYGTTWEVFQPCAGEQSFSHAWSAHPLVHLMQTVGGIRQEGPAWTKIVFEPEFFGGHSRTTVPTPRGLIRARWRRESGHIQVELHLPPGISARVKLPGHKESLTSRSRRWICGG